eukprot:jgi/Chlat1/4215/Chrsp27S04302
MEGLPNGSVAGGWQRAQPLSELVVRVTSAAHARLRALCTGLPGKSDSERKKALLTFLHVTRQHLLRLLVLAKWSSQMPAVSSCQQLQSILGAHDASFTAAADSLFFLHAQLDEACAPMYDIPTAVDVLSTGTVPRLPNAIAALAGPLPGVPVGTPEGRKLLARLDDRLRAAVYELALPRRCSVAEVSEGKLFLEVEDEFRATLTLGHEDSLDRWKLLSLDLLAGDGGNGTASSSNRWKWRTALTKNQRDWIREEFQRQLAATEQPLVHVYALLHELCLSVVLDQIVRQTVALKRGRWADIMKYETIQQATGVTGVLAGTAEARPSAGQQGSLGGVALTYWNVNTMAADLALQPRVPPPVVASAVDDIFSGLETLKEPKAEQPAMRLELDQDRFLVCRHSLQVLDPATQKAATFRINLRRVDVEQLLVYALQCHIYTALQRLADLCREDLRLCKAKDDVQLSSGLQPEDPFAQTVVLVRAHGDLFMTVAVNSRTGQLLLRAPEATFVGPVTDELQTALNSGTSSLVDALLALRFEVVKHLVRTAATSLGLMAGRPEVVAQLTSDISQLNANNRWVVFAFPGQGPFYLLVQLTDEYAMSFYLVRAEKTRPSVANMQRARTWVEIPSLLPTQQQQLGTASLEAGRVSTGWKRKLDVSEGEQQLSMKRLKMDPEAPVNGETTFHGKALDETLAAVVQQCWGWIRQARLASQLEAEGLLFTQELALRATHNPPSLRLTVPSWSTASGLGHGSLVDVCDPKVPPSIVTIRFMQPAHDSWTACISNQYFTLLHELSTGVESFTQTASSPSNRSALWSTEVDTTHVAATFSDAQHRPRFSILAADQHIRLTATGLQLQYQEAHQSPVKALIGDIARVRLAQGSVVRLAAALQRRKQDSLQDSQVEPSGDIWLAEVGPTHAVLRYRMQMDGVKQENAPATTTPPHLQDVQLRIELRWTLHTGCSVRVVPSDIYPSVQLLEQYINKREEGLVVDTLCSTALPFTALAAVMRQPSSLPVAFPPPPSATMTASGRLPIAITANGGSFKAPLVRLPSMPSVASLTTTVAPVTSTPTIASTTTATTTTTPAVASDLPPPPRWPLDVIRLQRSLTRIRLVFKGVFPFDMRVFSPNHIWLGEALDSPSALLKAGVPDPVRFTNCHNLPSFMNDLAGKLGSKAQSLQAGGVLLAGLWVSPAQLDTALRRLLRKAIIKSLIATLPEMVKSTFKNSKEGGWLCYAHQDRRPAVRFMARGYGYEIFAGLWSKITLRVQKQPLQDQEWNAAIVQANLPREQPQSTLTDVEITELCNFFTCRVACEPVEVCRMTPFLEMLALPLNALHDFIALIAWERKLREELSQELQTKGGLATPPVTPRNAKGKPPQPPMVAGELCLSNAAMLIAPPAWRHSAPGAPVLRHDRSTNTVECVVGLYAAKYMDAPANSIANIPYVAVALRYAIKDSSIQVAGVSVTGRDGSPVSENERMQLQAKARDAVAKASGKGRVPKQMAHIITNQRLRDAAESLRWAGLVAV